MKKNESFKWILFSSVKLGTQKRSVCTKNSECQTHAKEPRADTEQEESFMYSHVHVHTSFFSLIAAFNVRCSCFFFFCFVFHKILGLNYFILQTGWSSEALIRAYP